MGNYHLWSQIQLDNADIPEVTLERRARVERTRKPHRCRICRDDIPVGGACTSVTIAERGEGIGTVYEHTERCW